MGLVAFIVTYPPHARPNQITSQGSPPLILLEPSSPPLITYQHSTHEIGPMLPSESSSSSPSPPSIPIPQL